MDIDRLSSQDIKQMLKGEHKSQTKIQVGYGGDRDTEIRSVGDVWTDSEGVTWEQKKGYKLRVNMLIEGGKLDETKQFHSCPKETCECVVPTRLDRKFAKKVGMCTNCVQDKEFEHQLNGTFGDYAFDKILANAKAWLEDARSEKDGIVRELSTLEFANTLGNKEVWETQINKKELIQKIEAEFEKFERDFIQKLEKRHDTNEETNEQEASSSGAD